MTSEQEKRPRSGKRLVILLQPTPNGMPQRGVGQRLCLDHDQFGFGSLQVAN